MRVYVYVEGKRLRKINLLPLLLFIVVRSFVVSCMTSGLATIHLACGSGSGLETTARSKWFQVGRESVAPSCRRWYDTMLGKCYGGGTQSAAFSSEWKSRSSRESVGTSFPLTFCFPCSMMGRAQALLRIPQTSGWYSRERQDQRSELRKWQQEHKYKIHILINLTKVILFFHPCHGRLGGLPRWRI